MEIKKVDDNRRYNNNGKKFFNNKKKFNKNNDRPRNAIMRFDLSQGDDDTTLAQYTGKKELVETIPFNNISIAVFFDEEVDGAVKKIFIGNVIDYNAKEGKLIVNVRPNFVEKLKSNYVFDVECVNDRDTGIPIQIKRFVVKEIANFTAVPDGIPYVPADNAEEVGE